MSKKITPISGFPEFLPEQQLALQRAIDAIRTVYESFGFIPIETPAVERVEHLLEKGVQGKEVYVLRRLHEEGSAPAELALHFDLTVPLARYVAQHYGQLTFPFKRYQVQPVWRGERPQAGRYRQFYQCDIDIIGDGELSLYYDAEICAVIDRVFRTLQVGPFKVRLNHRKVLQGLLTSAGIHEEKQMHQAIKVIDEMEKVALEKTVSGFEALGVSKNSIEKLLEFFSLRASKEEMLDTLSRLSISTQFEAGVQQLREIVKFLRLSKVSDSSTLIDLKIARGLDYYTGVVYETVLNDHPAIGSICSGGRYEDLAAVFINRKLPGVGISIGLSRLIPQLIEAQVMKVPPACTAPVLVTMQNPSHLSRYIEMAERLRAFGIATELFLEKKKLGVQLKYADKKGVRLAVIADDAEWDRGVVVVKEMASGIQHEVALQDLEGRTAAILSSK